MPQAENLEGIDLAFSQPSDVQNSDPEPFLWHRFQVLLPALVHHQNLDPLTGIFRRPHLLPFQKEEFSPLIAHCRQVLRPLRDQNHHLEVYQRTPPCRADQER